MHKMVFQRSFRKNLILKQIKNGFLNFPRIAKSSSSQVGLLGSKVTLQSARANDLGAMAKSLE